jgi:DNA-binding NtrC family response regulator
MDIILIVEDKPEEQTEAKKAVLDSGAKVVMANTLEDANRLLDTLKGKITGILTDIHFPEREGIKGENPCGLAIVIRAIQERIPISICSDINHHFANYLEMIVKGLQNLTGQQIYFTMDRKDWARALKYQKPKEVKR